jgi:hypothetical protein
VGGVWVGPVGVGLFCATATRAWPVASMKYDVDFFPLVFSFFLVLFCKSLYALLVRSLILCRLYLCILFFFQDEPRSESLDVDGGVVALLGKEGGECIRYLGAVESVHS